MVFSKISHDEKQKSFMEKSLRTLWRPNNLKKDQILVELTAGNYCAPSFLSEKSNMNKLHRVNNYNVHKYAARFYDYIMENSKHLRSNMVFQPIGCDFDWYNGKNQYQNIERIVRYINNDKDKFQNFSIYFSTPSEYIAHLNKANATYPIKIDDYLPYAEDQSSYYVGYYTSKPQQK